MFRKHKETIPQKEISFRRLCLQALPEMWTFQILAGIFLIIPAAPMTRLIGWLAGLDGDVVTTANISNIHEAGKQAMVWTVNTEEGMYHFLDSFADGVITDEIVLAEEVQAELDDRTDLEVLEDKLQFN